MIIVIMNLKIYTMIFYSYDKNLLDSLSYTFADSIFRLINKELLYDNTLHTNPKEKDLEY